MSESAKSGLAEAVDAQKKRPVTSGMEISELPVHGSNKSSARIQTARSTPRLPKCRRLQRVQEVNRKDEMRGGCTPQYDHLPFLNASMVYDIGQRDNDSRRGKKQGGTMKGTERRPKDGGPASVKSRRVPNGVRVQFGAKPAQSETCGRAAPERRPPRKRT